MESDDESTRVIPFQLQFDKPAPFQIKLAEWNPEKDLLAMVTDDSKIILHRFNWQRLWTVSPGKSISSLCWRPDGKVIAVGLEDGAVSLHDVENGKLLRSMKSHNVAVVCLNWEEDDGHGQDVEDNFVYEDRTPRFFPPAPRVPRRPGVVSADSTLMDNNEDSFQDLLNTSHQRFNILCSADNEGGICFNIFGIFSIGKINIHSLSLPVNGEQVAYRVLEASIYKVALSKDLCRLIIICSGELSKSSGDFDHEYLAGHTTTKGLHCFVLDTSIFRRRKKELHQVAQQASNIEDLTEVIRASLSLMYKQWCDAMQTFHDKFHSLSTLIVSNGLDSSPQEELLSLLGGARTSPPVHQFLVNSLGEQGLKRVMKTVSSAGKELQLILLDHIQPAAEIIGFRMGELRGLSRWRARFGDIGLNEKLMDNATEKVGMFVVQIARFVQILAPVVQQFSNFFNWLLKCIKILMSESIDQLPTYNSELVVMFLKFLYDQDLVRLLLDQSATDHYVPVDTDTTKRVRELVNLGGFADVECLNRTLAKEFFDMESSFREAFNMPYTTISKEITCQHLLPLFPFPSSPPSIPNIVPASISFYWDAGPDVSTCETNQQNVVDYFAFQIPEWSSSDVSNCICIVQGIRDEVIDIRHGYRTFEVLLLSVSEDYSCVDLSLYKERQVVMLLNERATSDSNGEALLMILQTADLPFVSISESNGVNFWKLDQLQGSVLPLQMENAKVRSIPHNLIPPLAVSSSRGVGCVFTARKRALVYILEEDEEEETSDMD